VDRYNFKSVEEKWQKFWDKNKSFKSKKDVSKKKFYCLEMFPYPSGKIHMGHVRNYTIGDVIARFKKLQNFNVLHPMGWDSFGMPAENAAIQKKLHPKEWTLENIKAMKNQLKLLGFSIDWDREISTCDDNYYSHQQKFFLDLLKKGLVYKKESLVNWDPVDNTVLANEQVIDGKGWRTGAEVELKEIETWFLKITDYADELEEGLEKIDWPENVKNMQKNWIGKSRGTEISFETERGDVLKAFTTRPDTLFGVTFFGISPNHPFVTELSKSDEDISKFLNDAKKISSAEADQVKAEKLGYKTKVNIIHPLTKNLVPLWIINYVLMDYGTGAIMGVCCC